MRVPFVDLAAQQAEIHDDLLPEIEKVLRTAAFIGGRAVSDFEAQYADYVGVRHCIGVANGTDAVELALRACGVERGDEVVLPANTFIATAEAVSRIGAVPVLVDVVPDTLLIDPQQVDKALTPRTAAVVPVHLFGQIAPMDAIASICDGADVAVIEDAAQSQGARQGGQSAGSFGRAAATSFYPGKNLGAAGDAGAVTTDDPAVAERVRVIAAHGSATKYVHDVVGFNSRLDALQAVVLSAKLRRLDDWNTRRREAAARYDTLLSDVPGIRLPISDETNVDVWHLYVVRVADRDAVADTLAAEGVATGIHYPTPVHLTGAYRHLGYRSGDFPVTETAASEMLSLPMFPHITAAQQEHVADTVRRTLRV
ncbi:glutamine--scyllo-inositol aminotransferase [Rhodococcoides trifolii]|uniref:Glutamine--scyllo-inositol aminotransferase n=1 Tax=Rhodococcoides trifolii TaxID=908250 RepID=A0A917FLT1_9NOCA|nr:DegT/DnrJ/EryC1/StrS family aminotransferase [Rhodococcus trifolii]GGF90388.1 glutamine--scyllo-inositol aminotransferase [Rhodococcus trifolii]